MKVLLTTLCLSLAGTAFGLEAADDGALSEAAGASPTHNSGCEAVGEANIGGGPRFRPERLSEQSIARTFEANADLLHLPYQEARRADACLQGSLLFRVTVDGRGKVTALSYRASNQGISRLGEKMAPIINGLTFEAVGRPDTFEHMISLFPDLGPD